MATAKKTKGKVVKKAEVKPDLFHFKQKKGNMVFDIYVNKTEKIITARFSHANGLQEFRDFETFKQIGIGQSKCADGDEFNVRVGAKIAIWRAHCRIYNYRKDQMTKDFNSLVQDHEMMSKLCHVDF